MKAPHRVVVIGASAAGLRCASRLARLKPEWAVTVVESQEVFSYAACGLPYVLSGDIGTPEALRRTGDGALRNVDFFRAVKGVEVLSPWRAEDVDTSRRVLCVEKEGARQELPWDELVFATGARPRRLPEQPPHPRVRTFHVFRDVDPLHRGLARGEIRKVVIVGAGLVGCEVAEAFRALWDADVTRP